MRPLVSDHSVPEVISLKRVLLFFVLLTAASACQAAVEKNAESTAATNTESAASQLVLGAGVYATQCAECHGVNLEGEPNWREQNADGTFRAPPHDETGHTWHHGDRQLTEAILYGGDRLPDNIGGTSEMPAYAEVLTSEEIQAVLAFIKSSWPENIREAQTARSAAEAE